MDNLKILTGRMHSFQSRMDNIDGEIKRFRKSLRDVNKKIDTIASQIPELESRLKDTNEETR